jgi:hypothetical protein
MKFAVVEYSSKTKMIWRHTPERPNYLCDPIKEIDPTSFGCYVSALEGEHIPLNAIIAGNMVGLIPRIVRKVVKRLTGNWPSYSLSYFKQFDALLVVYQISDGHEMVRFVERLKREHPKQVIIGVPTQPYGILKEYWNTHPEKLKEMRDFMRHCDVFITIVKRTLPQWQKLSSTQVVYLPQPYPVEFASHAFRSRQKKSSIIFVAGVTGRDTITKGQIVAARLQKEFPSYRIQMAKVPDMELDVTNLVGTTYDIIPFQPWREHLSMLSRTALVINTDYTQTRGRVQVDCAAVGTPSIGANSDAQDDLFPKLPADRETSIEQLVLQGRQLLGDMSSYEEVVRTAQERLKAYGYEESKRRMQDLIQKVQESL